MFQPDGKEMYAPSNVAPVTVHDSAKVNQDK